jgi:hypothetical protein
VILGVSVTVGVRVGGAGVKVREGSGVAVGGAESGDPQPAIVIVISRIANREASIDREIFMHAPRRSHLTFSTAAIQ